MSELKDALEEARKRVGAALENAASVQAQVERCSEPGAARARRHAAEVCLAPREAAGGLEELAEALAAEPV